MEENKRWWESKGSWGAIVSVLGLILSQFGVEIGGEDQGKLVETIMQMVSGGGALLALYGRVTAKKAIK